MNRDTPHVAAAEGVAGPSVSTDWDPFDPDTLRDPLATHAALRSRCPVAYSERGDGFWSLLRYDDIVQAARDTQTFSNARTSRTPLRRQIPLESDPPEHTVFRRFLQTYFRPERLAALEPLVRKIVADLLAPLLARGHGDFIPELAYPLPARTLCAFLGQPDDDWLELKRMADELYRSDNRFSGQGDGGQAALEALYGYARSIVYARRAAPRDPADDLTSGLLLMAVDGQRLDEETIVGVLRLLLTAGHNSTTSALGIVALYLAEHPEVQDQLRAAPGQLPNAIEEILRWQTPVQFLPRVLTRDVEVRGRCLRKGDEVALVWASGNRDEAAWEQADQCLLDRDTKRSLVFGYGIHKCIGAPLARLELRVAFELLLAQTSRFTLAGPVARSHWPRYGVTTLPLTVPSSAGQAGPFD